MQNKTTDFFCLGAAHIDSKARACIKPAIGESIPTSISTCIGGVACNIASNLAIMNASVSLCSIIGADSKGRSLLEKLQKFGIDTDDIMLSCSKATASYFALLCERGELFIAAATMDIYDEMTPELLAPCLIRRRPTKHWVIDANLSARSIEALSVHKTPAQSLWGVGASSCKAGRLSAGFPHWRGLFLNSKELEALSGKQDIESGMRTVLREGCDLVVVTAGKEGLFYACGQKIEKMSSILSTVVDVTGAGDALCAGTLYGLFKHERLEEAIKRGMRAAALTLTSFHSSLSE